jgi:hypothetical protein
MLMCSGVCVVMSSGDNNHTEWDPLFSRYRLPPFIPPDAATALSWGLAGPNSGVPFHTHGAGYSEPVHGACPFAVCARVGAGTLFPAPRSSAVMMWQLLRQRVGERR